ncbi:MAG: helix-turn-helix domain-containing protein [Propionibacteriaceae bacterium]|jgi:predicted DNA-binding transcriptional regulator AlpA|nr:helix-turn-helix domain-containing protein [Propionibacteriaceae bacterium]
MSHKPAPRPIIDDCYALSSCEAAQRLGITAKTLANWRAKGEGPRFIRYGNPGGRVVYRQVDIDEFLSRHIVS